jgi:hypothetical protein
MKNKIHIAYTITLFEMLEIEVVILTRMYDKITVCMCVYTVYMYVCMCVCMSVCMYVCMNVFHDYHYYYPGIVCMYVCMYVCMSVFVCMYVCMYCMYVCMHVSMYVCMNVSHYYHLPFPSGIVKFNENPAARIAVFGLALVAFLETMKIPGSIIIAIVLASFVGINYPHCDSMEQGGWDLVVYVNT